MNDFLLLKRAPDAVRRERGLDARLSNRLLPRTGAQPYVVVRKAGANAFWLGDEATRSVVSSFAQPVSGDNLVPIDIPELGQVIEQKVRLAIDGVDGEILRQAADGRVLVKFTDGREEWKDLAKEDYVWL